MLTPTLAGWLQTNLKEAYFASELLTTCSEKLNMHCSYVEMHHAALPKQFSATCCAFMLLLTSI